MHIAIPEWGSQHAGDTTTVWRTIRCCKLVRAQSWRLSDGRGTAMTKAEGLGDPVSSSAFVCPYRPLARAVSQEKLAQNSGTEGAPERTRTSSFKNYSTTRYIFAVSRQGVASGGPSRREVFFCCIEGMSPRPRRGRAALNSAWCLAPRVFHGSCHGACLEWPLEESFNMVECRRGAWIGR